MGLPTAHTFSGRSNRSAQDLHEFGSLLLRRLKEKVDELSKYCEDNEVPGAAVLMSERGYPSDEVSQLNWVPPAHHTGDKSHVSWELLGQHG